jgi:hypothetical protein
MITPCIVLVVSTVSDGPVQEPMYVLTVRPHNLNAYRPNTNTVR